MTILDSSDLALLKAGYDRAYLTGKAAAMISYSKAQGLASWIGNTIYRLNGPPSSLEFYEREIVITAVVAAQGDVFVLSGHIYWTLMEYLSRSDSSINPVEKVADVLLTVAAYQGVNNFRASRDVLQDVLRVLKIACTNGQATTQEILPRLLEEFPSRP